MMHFPTSIFKHHLAFRQILTFFHFIFDKFLRTEIICLSLPFLIIFFNNFPGNSVLKRTNRFSTTNLFNVRNNSTLSIVEHFYCLRNSLLQVYFQIIITK